MKSMSGRMRLAGVAALAALVLFFGVTGARELRDARVLSEQAQSKLDELRTHYSKRTELVQAWTQAMGSNPPASSAIATARSLYAQSWDRAETLALVDAAESRLSQLLSELIANPKAQATRPRELERVEESINFARRDYHQRVFQLARGFGLARMLDSRLKRQAETVFPAEALLQKQGLNP